MILQKKLSYILRCEPHRLLSFAYLPLTFPLPSSHTRLRQLADFPSLNLRSTFAYPSLNLRHILGCASSPTFLRCGIAVQNGTFWVGIKTKFARLLIILYLCALDLINYKNGRRNIQPARKCCLFGR